MMRRSAHAARSQAFRAVTIATKQSGDGTMPATYEMHVSQAAAQAGGTLLSEADFASAQNLEAQRKQKKTMTPFLI